MWKGRQDLLAALTGSRSAETFVSWVGWKSLVGSVTQPVLGLEPSSLRLVLWLCFFASSRGLTASTWRRGMPTDAAHVHLNADADALPSVATLSASNCLDEMLEPPLSTARSPLSQTFARCFLSGPPPVPGVAVKSLLAGPFPPSRWSCARSCHPAGSCSMSLWCTSSCTSRTSSTSTVVFGARLCCLLWCHKREQRHPELC